MLCERTDLRLQLICPTGNPGCIRLRSPRQNVEKRRARKRLFAQAFQRDLGRPVPSRKNISLFLRINRWLPVPHPVPLRGALAIVTNVGRDAVDAAASGAWSWSQGGLWSVSEHSVQTTGESPAKPFGGDGWLRTAKPCGPGTRCWCQAGGGFTKPNRVSMNR
jgi:hypothetical protein